MKRENRQYPNTGEKPFRIDIKDVSKLTSKEINALINDVREYFTDIAEVSRIKDELEIRVKERTVELEQSEEKYRLLVENANEVIVVAQDGLIKFVNRKGLEMTGYSLKEIADKPLLEAVHPDDRQLVMGRYQRRIAGEVEPYRYVLRVVPKDGSTRWAQMNAAKIIWNGRPAVLAMFTDITEHKKAEKALKESEEKYRSLVENATEAVVVYQDNMIKFFNHGALDLSGYSKEELAFQPMANLIDPADRDLVLERHFKRIQGEKIPSSYEFRLIRKDGSTKWVVINAVLTTWEGKPAVLGLMTDITERKNLEQEIKAHIQRITQVQEEERKRIAYELHDDTAQYLALLKLELDSLLQSGKIQNPEIIKKLKYLEKDAGRALDDIRRYSHELRPGVLEHLGLYAALEQIAEDINKLNYFTVEVEVEGEESELSEDVKLGLFRIAQEAINNCRKHAKASKAIISLKFDGNNLRMAVSDNGAGFDVQKSVSHSKGKGSLGMMSMRERAKMIGADLRIESELGKGTTVIVEIPL